MGDAFITCGGGGGSMDAGGEMADQQSIVESWAPVPESGVGANIIELMFDQLLKLM